MGGCLRTGVSFPSSSKSQVQSVDTNVVQTYMHEHFGLVVVFDEVQVWPAVPPVLSLFQVKTHAGWFVPFEMDRIQPYAYGFRVPLVPFPPSRVRFVPNGGQWFNVPGGTLLRFNVPIPWNYP